VNRPGAANGLDLGPTIRQRWLEMPIPLTSGSIREDRDTHGFALLQKSYRASDVVEVLRSLLSDSREVTPLEGPLDSDRVTMERRLDRDIRFGGAHRVG
jgi:hypothetical protein